jgi:hypothetical protein
MVGLILSNENNILTVFCYDRKNVNYKKRIKLLLVRENVVRNIKYNNFKKGDKVLYSKKGVILRYKSSGYTGCNSTFVKFPTKLEYMTKPKMVKPIAKVVKVIKLPEHGETIEWNF